MSATVGGTPSIALDPARGHWRPCRPWTANHPDRKRPASSSSRKTAADRGAVAEGALAGLPERRRPRFCYFQTKTKGGIRETVVDLATPMATPGRTLETRSARTPRGQALRSAVISQVGCWGVIIGVPPGMATPLHVNFSEAFEILKVRFRPQAFIRADKSAVRVWQAVSKTA